MNWGNLNLTEAKSIWNIHKVKTIYFKPEESRHIYRSFTPKANFAKLHNKGKGKFYNDQ